MKKQFINRALLGLLVFAPFVADAQVPGRDCEKVYSLLSSAQRTGDTKESATLNPSLYQAIQLAPRCADAYLLLGLAEFHNGAAADAIEHYKKAVQLQPRSYSAHYDLALAYLKEQKLEEARAQLEDAVRVEPNHADAWYDLGIVLQETGHLAEALIRFKRARALDSKRPDVAFNIVRADLALGNKAAARSEARDSAKQFGSDPQWCAAVGQLFTQSNEGEDAIPYLLKAHHRRPEDAELRHDLAAAYLQAGKPDQVLLTIADPKTSDDHYLRAGAYYLSQRFSEADAESEKALSLAPDSPQILVLRTRLLQRAGKQEEALQLAQKAISLAPTWDQPYYLAGVSSYFLRVYDDAVRNLTRALELDPNSARALFVEHIALANLGKLADAERSLRRAIDLQPTNARFYCHLGILMERKNNNADAERFFKKAIQLQPEYALSHYELGKLLASTNDPRPAASQLEQAIQYDKNLSSAYYQLGRIYAKLGESEKSGRILAEFRRLHKQDLQDPRDDQAHDDDAKKEAEAQ